MDNPSHPSNFQEKVPYAVVANVSEGALELQLRPMEAQSLLEDVDCGGDGRGRSSKMAEKCGEIWWKHLGKCWVYGICKGKCGET